MDLRPPKDVKKNLRFRQKILAATAHDFEAQHELWVACARSPIFFVNTFGWTYDPRKPDSRIPFITWDFQDRAILEMNAEIDDSAKVGAFSRNVLIEKSRDMGASWLMLLVFQWRWQFRPFQSFLVASRKEDLVDKTGDPDSLFWKLDFILEHQPRWLRPQHTRTNLQFANDENGSTISGESTNVDLGRGGRRTAILIDEAASVPNLQEVDAATADVTRCRFFNSTPKGKNYFWRIRENAKTKIIRLHWPLHPEKAMGLYTSTNGKLKRLDEINPTPSDYPHALDDKVRSPWYDSECASRANPIHIAQELDIDYGGSVAKFFDWDVLSSILARDTRSPLTEGILDYADDTVEPMEFQARPQGNLQLWIALMANMKPPAGRYGIGVDVSFGSRVTNSAATVVNKATGEKVAAFVVNNLKPSRFGRACVALAKWFSNDDHNATLIWETQGPGIEFGNAVLESGWKGVYRQKVETHILKKQTDRVGWGSSRSGKIALLGAYRHSLQSGRFINRCKLSIMECDEYVVGDNGDVYHSKLNTEEDPTGTGANHGDRVMADALANKLLDIDPVTVDAELAAHVPYGSFAHRRQEWETKQRDSLSW